MKIESEQNNNLTKGNVNKKINSEYNNTIKNDMIKLVISVENDIGKKRLMNLNYDYIHIKAVTKAPKWILDNFKLFHNEDINSKKTKAKMACFSSHIKALEYIVKNKLDNVVILEDDAFLDGEIIDNFPDDGACLLGATLRHPTNWNKDAKFRKNNVNDIIKKFKIGINTIDYNIYRWTQAHAIYYPNWTVAKINLNIIKKSKYKYKHYDIFLSDRKLVKYLHYPSIFTHDDRKSVTQVSKTNNGYIKNYIL